MATLSDSRYYSLLYTRNISSGTLETELATQSNLDDFLYLFRTYRAKKQLFATAYDILFGSDTACIYTVIGTAVYLNNDYSCMLMSFQNETPYGFYINSLVDNITSLTTAAGTSAPVYMKGFTWRSQYYNSGGSYYDWVREFNFGTKTFTLLNSGWGGSNVGLGSIATQDNHRSFFGGGKYYTGTVQYYNILIRLPFGSTSGLNLLSATLADGARYNMAGLSSPTVGYYIGGHTGSSASTVVDGLTFATEASYNPSATLGTGQESPAAGQNTTVGYLFGGYNNPTYATAIQKMTFSTDTLSTPSATLTTGRAWAGCSSAKLSLYVFGGGNTSGVVRSIEKFVMATETQSVLSADFAGPGANNGLCLQGAA